MRIYLIDGLFEVRAMNEQSARNKSEKKLRGAIETIVDITDERENENETAQSDIAIAAAALGRKGGLAGTPAQNAARANNSKNAGRRKGSKNKPKGAI